MNFENLQPVSVDHAVQSMHFVIEWGGALSSDSVLGLGKLQAKFRNLGYAQMAPQNMLHISLDGNMPAPSHGLAGYVFMQRPQPDVGRQISLTAENCSIMFPDYTRWENVFSSIKDVLKIVLDEIGSQRPLRSIGLQYVDAFVWNDDPTELDLNEVFKDDFVIPPHVFLQKGLWHLHHGYFESFRTPLSHSVLQNINVDALDTLGRRVIQILGSHKANLDQPLWQPHMKNQEQFFAMVSHLHELNKTMLRSLLTKKVCELIKLDS